MFLVSDYKVKDSDLYVLSSFNPCRTSEISDSDKVAALDGPNLDQVRDIVVNKRGQYIYIQTRANAPANRLVVCEIEVFGTLVSHETPEIEPPFPSGGTIQNQASIVSWYWRVCLRRSYFEANRY